MRLSEAEENKNYVIKSFEETEHFESRISAMGIRKGVNLTILRNKKKLPILIYCRDTMIALGRGEAEKIMVGGSEDE